MERMSARAAPFNQGGNLRTPVAMMFIAAFALATDADARKRGGGKSYRSSSSYSHGYKPQGKRCGNSYIAANKTCRIGSYAAPAAAAAAVGTGAVVGSAFADDTPSPPPGTATPAIEQLRTAYALTDAAYVMNLPSQSAGRIRRLKMNELVTVHEVIGDWVRISPSTTSEEWVMKAYISTISP